MNGFEKHGLSHTSASQINMWEEAPAAWVARYLFNKRFFFGVAPQIGILTEEVVAKVLTGTSFDAALEQAHKTFNKNNATNTNEKQMARIHDIKAMAEIALEQLKPYGEPEFACNITQKQHRIDLTVKGDGWDLPCVGYLDFVYPNHGLVIDLKTTLRCPSTMSRSHERQAALYGQAKGNMAVKFLYVTPKKHNLLEVEDRVPVLNEIKAILNRQERLLRAMDKDEIRDCIPLGLSSFYWNGSEEILEELYGLSV